jgi:hypothetical protein
VLEPEAGQRDAPPPSSVGRLSPEVAAAPRVRSGVVEARGEVGTGGTVRQRRLRRRLAA